MSKEAMKLALEALEVATTPLARDRQEVLRAITAIREALAEQPAQQHDGETVVQTFTGLPKRKLSDLLAAGWQINGVCFQRTEEDGTVRRGAATTGGMVLWWNSEQPAQQQKPVAWVREHELPLAPGDAFSWVKTFVHKTPLYTSPPAQRKPLTDEQIAKMIPKDPAWDNEVGEDAAVAFARAIEAAHQIGVEK